MTGVSSRWRHRAAAQAGLAARPKEAKRESAFFARLAEHEVIARLIHRKYGVALGRARHMALTAPTSPVSLGRAAKGQPPSNHELYEGVERVRIANGGKLPIARGSAFWKTFTLQWNAWVAFDRPERQFVTMDGEPDWRALRAAHRMTTRGLERRARAICLQALQHAPRPTKKPTV